MRSQVCLLSQRVLFRFKPFTDLWIMNPTLQQYLGLIMLPKVLPEAGVQFRVELLASMPKTLGHRNIRLYLTPLVGFWLRQMSKVPLLLGEASGFCYKKKMPTTIYLQCLITWFLFQKKKINLKTGPSLRHTRQFNTRVCLSSVVSKSTQCHEVIFYSSDWQGDDRHLDGWGHMVKTVFCY